jgi:hypothetical protein
VNRKELVKVVDLVTAAWNMDTDSAAFARTVRAWWRYLHDLEYSDVINVVDRLVVTSPWPPKVGELRRKVLDLVSPTDWPTAGEAWAQAQERIRSLEQGTEWVELHPFVGEAMRHAGLDGRGRADQRQFTDAYDKVVASAQESRLLPPMPEPFGDLP